MHATLFHDTRCSLGEGPIWDGDRFYFFDILAGRLHALDRAGAALKTWQLGRMGSAAARLEGGGLLVATETALCRFDPESGRLEDLVPVEADSPATRSNDGRADRRGGFWFGTMSKTAEPGAGALYRYHGGAVTRLTGGITVPNAISFSPDGGTAYFADSAKKRIFRWTLDAEGWPVGEPQTHFEMGARPGVPDGAVVDAAGRIWCAIWDGATVIAIDPAGHVTAEVPLSVPRPTCPAFGPDGRLYVTSATEGLDDAMLEAAPQSGGVLVAGVEADPLPEPALPDP